MISLTKGGWKLIDMKLQMEESQEQIVCSVLSLSIPVPLIPAPMALLCFLQSLAVLQQS